MHYHNTGSVLDLTGNTIGDKGVTALAEALHDNAVLATLNLEWNAIGGSGVVSGRP